MDEWFKQNVLAVFGIVAAIVANAGAWLWKIARLTKEIEDLKKSAEELHESSAEAVALAASISQLTSNMASVKATVDATGANVVKLMVEMGMMGQAQAGLRDELKSIRYELNRLQGEIDKVHQVASQASLDVAQLRGEHRQIHGAK